jgi:hypothetical protein
MTNKIEAHVRMEEKYEGLSLRFGDNPQLKKDVLEAIEYAKEKTGKRPMVFENISKDHPEREAIYIEFNDDVQRDAGDFFEIVLHRLNVLCEQDD